MFLALGCDINIDQAKTLYKRAKEIEGELPKEMNLSLAEYATLINIYIEENCDEVDGLIETIRDRYDPESTGKCKYSQIIEFMEEHKYLEADKE